MFSQSACINRCNVCIYIFMDVMFECTYICMYVICISDVCYVCVCMYVHIVLYCMYGMWGECVYMWMYVYIYNM